MPPGAGNKVASPPLPFVRGPWWLGEETAAVVLSGGWMTGTKAGLGGACSNEACSGEVLSPKLRGHSLEMFVGLRYEEGSLRADWRVFRMSLGETVVGEAGLAVLSAWRQRPVGPAGAGVSHGGPLLRPAPRAEQGLTGPQRYCVGVMWQGAQDGQAQGTQARTGPTE